MTIEIPEQLEATLREHASVRGISPEIYLREILERDLYPSSTPPKRRLKSSYGILAKYGPAPTAEEIDENRRDMLRGSIFAEDTM